MFIQLTVLDNEAQDTVGTPACPTCGHVVAPNHLVASGLIDAKLAEILVVPQGSKRTVQRSRPLGPRVLTGKMFLLVDSGEIDSNLMCQLI